MATCCDSSSYHMLTSGIGRNHKLNLPNCHMARKARFLNNFAGHVQVAAGCPKLAFVTAA